MCAGLKMHDTHEAAGLTASQFAWRVVHRLPFPPPNPKRGRERYGTHPLCWLCGGPTDGVGWPRAVAIAPTFTNHNVAAVPTSDAVCEACVATSHGDAWRAYGLTRPDLGLKTAQPLAWRSYSHLFVWPHHHECPQRARLRALLRDPPPPPFLLVVAESGQKHILFRARVAWSRERFPVQLEEDTVRVERARFAQVLAAFEALYALGFSKDSVLTGRYHSGQLAAVGLRAWRAAEAAFAPYRLEEPALVRLAHYCAQKPAAPAAAAPETEEPPVLVRLGQAALF